MRAHEGDEAARRIDRARRVEVAIDLFGDRLRGAGIPAAGDRGRANRGDHGQAIHPPPHRGQDALWDFESIVLLCEWWVGGEPGQRPRRTG